MALEKRIVHQQLLGVDPAGGSSFTNIASIVDGWEGPDTEADEGDTTVLADTYKTSKRAQVDPGTVSLGIAYDPNDANTQTLVDLYDSGDIATWQITFTDEGSGTATETFSGWVKSFNRTMGGGATTMVMANLVVRVTGNPGFTGSGA